LCWSFTNFNKIVTVLELRQRMKFELWSLKQINLFYHPNYQHLRHLRDCSICGTCEIAACAAPAAEAAAAIAACAAGAARTDHADDEGSEVQL
jgi:hypothetical protein